MTWWNAPTLTLLDRAWTWKVTRHQVTIKISPSVSGFLRLHFSQMSA